MRREGPRAFGREGRPVSFGMQCGSTESFVYDFRTSRGAVKVREAVTIRYFEALLRLRYSFRNGRNVRPLRGRARLSRATLAQDTSAAAGSNRGRSVTRAGYASREDALGLRVVRPLVARARPVR